MKRGDLVKCISWDHTWWPKQQAYTKPRDFKQIDDVYRDTIGVVVDLFEVITETGERDAGYFHALIDGVVYYGLSRESWKVV